VRLVDPTTQYQCQTIERADAIPPAATLPESRSPHRHQRRLLGSALPSVDDGEEELDPLKAFIIPGGTPKAAALHVARTVCRRAERRVVHLRRDADTEIPQLVVIYLNRLSDLLFVLARVANRRAGAGEVTW